MRLIYVEVDDTLLWLILTSTEDGFAEATAWANGIVSGIEFC